MTPFRLSVVTDANEVLGATGNNMAMASEASGAGADSPLGTMGFSLTFQQIPC